MPFEPDDKFRLKLNCKHQLLTQPPNNPASLREVARFF